MRLKNWKKNTQNLEDIKLKIWKNKSSKFRMCKTENLEDKKIQKLEE